MTDKKENERLPLLIVQPSLPAYRQDFFCCLAETLGRNITVLHFGKKSNIKHPLVDELIGGFFEFRGLKYIKGLGKLIKIYPEIVICFDPHWINLFFLPIFRKEKKVVLWGHGAGRNKIINSIRVPIINRAPSFITYSNEKKSLLVELGVERKKIHVAHNTLAVSNSQDTSRSSKKNFLFVGRLQRRKKLDIFFEVFSRLELSKLGYTITVVGDGAEEKKFLSKCAFDLGISENVKFIEGTTDSAKLLSCFSDAAYYVSPGAVGLGVLHSFAYGVPVLTIQDPAHGPEVSNIKNGHNGFVFPDKEAFASQLLSLLDSSLQEEMGKKAFVFYNEERSIERMVDGFVKALK